MGRKEEVYAERLWVPLLTHWREDTGGHSVDLDRTAAHIRAIRPHVRGYLLAGSTGDGWEIDDKTVLNVLRLVEHEDALDETCGFLVGCFAGSTQEVLTRAAAVEAWLREARPRGCFLGLTICPPVDPNATQTQILAHYEAILAATSSDVAVYQLPQVTGCEIEAGILARLARTGRIRLFKDTSGADRIALAGAPERVRMLRGAEGRYAESLKPEGLYDGFLLSTANVFAPEIGHIISLSEAGNSAEAAAFSKRIEDTVARLFQLAEGVPSGNPFSNANRAVDHLFAYGKGWRQAELPRLASGATLSIDFLEATEREVLTLRPSIDPGYLHEEAG